MGGSVHPHACSLQANYVVQRVCVGVCGVGGLSRGGVGDVMGELPHQATTTNGGGEKGRRGAGHEVGVRLSRLLAEGTARG